MRYPFESQEARKLNIQIFETLYYGALEASCEIAIKKGLYESYEGSPVSKGVSIQKNIFPVFLISYIKIIHVQAIQFYFSFIDVAV